MNRQKQFLDQSPQPGALALDRERGRVGVVMATEGGRVFLRPPEGGREWEVRPESVEPAGTEAELRGRVSELNRQPGRLR